MGIHDFCIYNYLPQIQNSLFLYHKYACWYDCLESSDGEATPVSDLHGLPTKFMTFWTTLFLNMLVIQLIFYCVLLVLPPDCLVKSGLCSSHFFTILRALFLLVRHAFMVALTGLWLRISNNLTIAIPIFTHYERWQSQT